MAFKDYLRAKLTEKGMRPAELARASGVTKQNIGRILNDTRHPISGGLPKVTVETIEKLAKGLGVDVDEAKIAAGFIPPNIAGMLMRLPSLEGFNELSPEAQKIVAEQIRGLIAAFRKPDVLKEYDLDLRTMPEQQKPRKTKTG